MSEFDRMVAEFGSRQELWKHLFEYRDGELFRKVTRSSNAREGELAGSGASSCGYWRIQVDDKMLRRHRIIYEMHHGDVEGLVDHIDRNRRNDTVDNLRICTLAENNHNQGLRADSKTGLKGVSFKKERSKWVAQIGLGGIRKHLGYFTTPEEAARAYDTAAKIHFGAFAALNFSE
jgi:hypothetical protein